MPVKKEIIRQGKDAEDVVRWQIVKKDGWAGQPLTKQGIINAFNFPFTLNPGSGCFYKCSYCYLGQPFFARHVDLDGSREMNYKAGFVARLKTFLIKNKGLPQHMKRVQIGVATEVYQPLMRDYFLPQEILKTFRDYGKDWMIHLVTKCSSILDDLEILKEMRHQIQVEISLVTLDDSVYAKFERGTPTPSSRLKVIKTLSDNDIFVRTMCMPLMREMKMIAIGDSRYPVYRNKASGAEVAVVKSGRDSRGKGVQYFIQPESGKRQDITKLIDGFEPIILVDYTKAAEMHQVTRDLGAKAFKSKDLNYYSVAELIKATEEERKPKEEKGRFEDPKVELLVHSGESILGSDGLPIRVEVDDYTVSKLDWVDKKRPRVWRTKMDYGYKMISKIDWVDCE